MARLSQKELLDEGIGSMLKTAAKTAGGAVGAVGGALKAVSDAGINATWADAAKGGAAGAKKGWNILPGGDKEKAFKKMLEDRAWILKGKPRDGKNNMRVFDVVELDYDETGQPVEGRPFPRSAAFKFEKGKWEQKRNPDDGTMNRRWDRGQKDDKKDPHAADPGAADTAEEADTPPETPQPGTPQPGAPADVGTAGEFGVTPTFKPGDTVSFTNKKGEVQGVKVIKDLGTGKSEVKFSNGSEGAVDNKQLQATAEKEVSKESFSQKNLLRGLHMLHG